MHIESGVNPVGNTVSAELTVQSETVNHREPPPPYSPPEPGVVTNQPLFQQTIIVQTPLKNVSTFHNCPVCHNRVLTKVKYVNSRKTHMLAGFICGFTCWCMICCLGAIPYAINTFKKTEHYCPNCEALIGSYSKI